jgi:hypothetical protein
MTRSAHHSGMRVALSTAGRGAPRRPIGNYRAGHYEMMNNTLRHMASCNLIAAWTSEGVAASSNVAPLQHRAAIQKDGQAVI